MLSESLSADEEAEHWVTTWSGAQANRKCTTRAEATGRRPAQGWPGGDGVFTQARFLVTQLHASPVCFPSVCYRVCVAGFVAGLTGFVTGLAGL